jgi:hypothetical protein
VEVYMKLSMIALVAAGLVLAACAGSEEPATTYLADYGSHASALQASSKTHATAIAGAADVQSMAAMEQSHLSDMSGHIDGMAQDVGMMGMCADAQGGMMSTGMMGTVDDQAKAECARHQDAMMHAVDMNAAMMEEDAHQATMAAMMDHMMGMHDQMMTGGGMMGASGYTCPMMNAP